METSVQLKIAKILLKSNITNLISKFKELQNINNCNKNKVAEIIKLDYLHFDENSITMRKNNYKISISASGLTRCGLTYIGPEGSRTGIDLDDNEDRLICIQLFIKVLRNANLLK